MGHSPIHQLPFKPTNVSAFIVREVWLPGRGLGGKLRLAEVKRLNAPTGKATPEERNNGTIEGIAFGHFIDIPWGEAAP
jgi:hypothetical protein